MRKLFISLFSLLVLLILPVSVADAAELDIPIKILDSMFFTRTLYTSGPESYELDGSDNRSIKAPVTVSGVEDVRLVYVSDAPVSGNLALYIGNHATKFDVESCLATSDYPDLYVYVATATPDSSYSERVRVSFNLTTTGTYARCAIAQYFPDAESGAAVGLPVSLRPTSGGFTKGDGLSVEYYAASKVFATDVEYQIRKGSTVIESKSVAVRDNEEGTIDLSKYSGDFLCSARFRAVRNGFATKWTDWVYHMPSLKLDVKKSEASLGYRSVTVYWNEIDGAKFIIYSGKKKVGTTTKNSFKVTKNFDPCWKPAKVTVKMVAAVDGKSKVLSTDSHSFYFKY